MKKLSFFFTRKSSPRTLALIPTAWDVSRDVSRDVLGCREAFVWTINHLVEARTLCWLIEVA